MWRNIIDFFFSIVNIPNLHTLAKQIILIVDPLAQTDVFIKSLVEALGSGVEKIENSLKRVRSSKFTRLLSEMDQRRDLLFQALRDSIDSVCNSFMLFPEKAAAARVLADIIRRHGRHVHRENYSRQSMILNAMLQELKAAMAQVELAGATSLLEGLIKAQDEFELTFKQRVEEKGGREFPLLRDGRDDLVYRLSGLLSYIDQCATNNPQAYAGVVKEINELLTQTQTLGRMEQTRGENEDQLESVTAPQGGEKA